MTDRHTEKVTISESQREKDSELDEYGCRRGKQTEGTRQKGFLLEGKIEKEHEGGLRQKNKLPRPNSFKNDPLKYENCRRGCQYPATNPSSLFVLCSTGCLVGDKLVSFDWRVRHVPPAVGDTAVQPLEAATAESERS